MSALAAQVALLVTHFAAILKTFGDRAIPVATFTLQVLDKTGPLISKLVPAAAPFVQAIQVALTFLVQHGPEIGADFEKALGLLDSVKHIAPQLSAAAQQ